MNHLMFAKMKNLKFAKQATTNFFNWVTKSGKVDVPALVTEAEEEAKKYTWSCQEALAHLLGNKLYMLFEEVDNVLPGVLDEEAVVVPRDGEPGYDDYSTSHLIFELLGASSLLISYEEVAEAILKQQGKWAPKSKKPLKKKPVEK